MLTIAYSTRESNPKFTNYLKKTSGVKDIQVLEKINKGEKTLSKVYNEILEEAQNDFIIFCHDDIEFETNKWGKKLLEQFNKNQQYGIIGVAGTTDMLNGQWWYLKESMTGIVSHRHEGKKWTNYYSQDQGNKIKEVVVVDGLFFCIDKRKIKHNFDEDFNGFHFYEIPFCFSNFISGVKVGVTTSIRITHKSIGMTNDQWLENKLKFEEKFKNDLPIRLSNNKTIEEKSTLDIDKLGVAMVSFNAEHRINQSGFFIPKWVKHFVIVNDGTPYNESSYPNHAHIIQHETNLGVGQAKSTAMKYLMDLGCEHIFIIEDDILIKDENVFQQYIKHSVYSGIKHLNFALHGPANRKGAQGFNTLDERVSSNTEPNPSLVIPYESDVQIALYPNSVGAFSYYHRSVLENIGFFDKVFKNAWEHVEHTYQAIKTGFHPPFWYFADINKSWDYLTEIPNSIEESTIARSPEWIENYNSGAKWFRTKHSVLPTQIPLVNQQEVINVLKKLYNKR